MAASTAGFVIASTLATCLALVGGGCESKATPSGAAGAAPARSSKELESCAATADCAEGLRCLDQVCARETRSMVGDYLAARGARALADGDTAGAIAAYTEASAAYEGEKLAVPPDVDCGWGQALVAARAQKDKAELAARLLHRCLLAVPPGGALRAAALASLTELDGSGFDPKQLARPQLADLYLTRAPSKPDPGNLAASVTADPTPKTKSWPVIAERLGRADVKAALVGCWDAAYAARAQRVLTAKLGFKYVYMASDYEDEPGKYTYGLDAAADGDAACVKAALAAALADLKGPRDGFTTALTVTVK